MADAYQFHHIVRLTVETEDQVCREYFRQEYAPYLLSATPPSSGPQAPLPLVRLQCWHGGWRNAPFAGLPHRHKMLARWVYRVDFTSHGITIWAQGNRWAIPMIHHMLVHPALRMLAARQGFLMLHAGAVAYQGRSLILTGSGGVGKTTTTSLLLARGGSAWALHADDYVFLSPAERRSYAYLTRAHVYWPLLTWVPELKKRLRWPERLRARLLWLLRRWSGERLKWPVRVSARRLWPQHPYQAQAHIGAVIWLARGANTHAILRPMQPSAREIEQLLDINFFEARHFLALLAAQGEDARPRIAAWREQEGVLLQELATQAPWYRLHLPTRAHDSGFVPKLQSLLQREAS